VALLLAAAVWQLLRWLIDRRRNTVLVTYENGLQVRIRRGLSVLDASGIAGIPHAAVCGGRGRCSTCRIRVLEGQDMLAPPMADEHRVLERVQAADDVRLACQLKPVADLKVAPLVPTDKAQSHVMRQMNPEQGSEREIVVMFADLRSFTRFSENRLPYDVVFILNRYFRLMGEAIEQSGGQVDKFIGDGIMALFGIHADNGLAARQAVDASRRMSEALATLNANLESELRVPLRMGIGLHFGPAIVGQMGYGASQSMTAIGDTVNVASRLESASKELSCELVMSEDVANAAGLEETIGRRAEIEVRGRSRPLAVRAIDTASNLPPAKQTRRVNGLLAILGLANRSSRLQRTPFS
jgi:adenylate cyclase